jgi:hypothetical protein
MMGWATPTVEPFFGTNVGGPNGAVPVNGVGFCPAAGPAATGNANGGGAGANGSAGGGGGNARGGGNTKGGGAGGSAGAATTPGSPGAGSGSARAGPAPSTSRAANPAAFRAAKRLPLVQLDICIPPVTLSTQCRIARKPATYSAAPGVPTSGTIHTTDLLSYQSREVAPATSSICLFAAISTGAMPTSASLGRRRSVCKNPRSSSLRRDRRCRSYRKTTSRWWG